MVSAKLATQPIWRQIYGKAFIIVDPIQPASVLENITQNNSLSLYPNNFVGLRQMQISRELKQIKTASTIYTKSPKSNQV